MPLQRAEQVLLPFRNTLPTMRSLRLLCHSIFPGIRNFVSQGPKFLYGVATDVGGTADKVVYRNITFQDAFSRVPSVVACAQSTNPSTCSVSVANVTTAGFRIELWRSNTADTDIFWMAVGR